jgi:hypothetical protein
MRIMMPSSSYDTIMTMLKSVVDIALLKGRYFIDMIERRRYCVDLGVFGWCAQT